MRILLLGGTRFVGRHIVTECLTRGDDVTVLYRAQSPSPFVGLLRHVVTDRRAPTPEAATVLAEPWDAVIDTSASDLDDLQATTALLSDVATYVMLSTCGVYSRNRQRGEEITELSPTVQARPTDPVRASATRKLRCERFLQRWFERSGVPLLIARLGLIVGAYDYSDRLAYWLERALRGGDTLVPMGPDQPVQLIDVVDVARFLRTAIDQAVAGVVNLAGCRISALDMVDAVFNCTDGGAIPRWVGEDFALANGLRPWTQVPLWLPAHSPERALMCVSSDRAVQAGLVRAPLVDTVTACLAWQTVRRGWSQQWLDRTRELQILQQWRG
ncbi:NAD-dependent epimerase/dehydratase family protein [Phytohabitans sp. ZYX-F-186]|uniref:NAD-dependent epimerase/dehydratase family protein n=1 Tax=Phytohabitans maris TaxID=3071409 RepID=A0ABU0ZAW9_9ACTN|nr:NAD-dependent epimerase/dehydratase family protein [Phytohabitans sp. ZYX-F-186]MDQ7903500.1 NAD-dependent epimerase/dehydratase family protein [Phytohabitans sp. ZYX-F-186]